MNKIKLTIITLLIAAISSTAYSQSLGELDRFDDESLELRNKVRLFPNPTIDYLSIEIINSNLEDVEFTVHNIIGNIVEVDVDKISNNEFKIDVESLPTGYYLVAIKDNKTHFRETYKFLKQ